MKAMGGGGVDVLRAEYLIEHASEIPGRGRRLIALLGRVLQRARLHEAVLDPMACSYYALATEITAEISARAADTRDITSLRRTAAMRLSR